MLKQLVSLKITTLNHFNSQQNEIMNQIQVLNPENNGDNFELEELLEDQVQDCHKALSRCLEEMADGGEENENRCSPDLLKADSPVSDKVDLFGDAAEVVSNFAQELEKQAEMNREEVAIQFMQDLSEELKIQSDTTGAADKPSTDQNVKRIKVLVQENHSFYQQYGKKLVVGIATLNKLLFKLTFESLLLNSQFLSVQYMLNLRKLLKIPYLFDNLSTLSLQKKSQDSPAQLLNHHKQIMCRQLILDIFKDLNISAKLQIAKVQKEPTPLTQITIGDMCPKELEIGDMISYLEKLLDFEESQLGAGSNTGTTSFNSQDSLSHPFIDFQQYMKRGAQAQTNHPVEQAFDASNPTDPYSYMYQQMFGGGAGGLDIPEDTNEQEENEQPMESLADDNVEVSPQISLQFLAPYFESKGFLFLLSDYLKLPLQLIIDIKEAIFQQTLASCMVIGSPIVVDANFEIYRTLSGNTYIGQAYLNSILVQAKEDDKVLPYLQLKLLAALTSQAPAIVSKQIEHPVEDCLLDFRQFEYRLFGGFINYAQVEPGSQLIQYVMNADDNWRDPFKDSLANKFPRLIKTMPVQLHSHLKK